MLSITYTSGNNFRIINNESDKPKESSLSKLLKRVQNIRNRFKNRSEEKVTKQVGKKGKTNFLKKINFCKGVNNAVIEANQSQLNKKPVINSLVNKDNLTYNSATNKNTHPSLTINKKPTKEDVVDNALTLTQGSNISKKPSYNFSNEADKLLQECINTFLVKLNNIDLRNISIHELSIKICEETDIASASFIEKLNGLITTTKDVHISKELINKTLQKAKEDINDLMNKKFSELNELRDKFASPLTSSQHENASRRVEEARSEKLAKMKMKKQQRKERGEIRKTEVLKAKKDFDAKTLIKSRKKPGQNFITADTSQPEVRNNHKKVTIAKQSTNKGISDFNSVKPTESISLNKSQSTKKATTAITENEIKNKSMVFNTKFNEAKTEAKNFDITIENNKSKTINTEIRKLATAMTDEKNVEAAIEKTLDEIYRGINGFVTNTNTRKQAIKDKIKLLKDIDIEIHKGKLKTKLSEFNIAMSDDIVDKFKMEVSIQISALEDALNAFPEE